MRLDDGTNVRKDGVEADGTLVMIKPDTKSGRDSAKSAKNYLIKTIKQNIEQYYMILLIRIIKKGTINISGLKEKQE